LFAVTTEAPFSSAARISAGEEPRGVRSEQAPGDVHVPGCVGSTHGHPDEVERGTDSRGEVGGLLVEQTHHLAAHRAASEQRESQRLGHGVLTLPFSLDGLHPIFGYRPDDRSPRRPASGA